MVTVSGMPAPTCRLRKDLLIRIVFAIRLDAIYKRYPLTKAADILLNYTKVKTLPGVYL